MVFNVIKELYQLNQNNIFVFIAGCLGQEIASKMPLEFGAANFKF